jgi:hypothetical protein
MMRQNNDRKSLDVIRNINHFSFKVPGIIVWTFWFFAFVGCFFYPRLILWVARFLAFYILIKLIFNAVFFVVGIIRSKRLEKAWKTGTYSLPAAGDLPIDVHHIVIIPNVNEPIDLLRRTLDRLAIQYQAQKQINIVLAMEETEHEEQKKIDTLCNEYKDKFERIFGTIHPCGLEGDIVGKSSNESWAAKQAKIELIDRQHLPIESFTITPCDADSLFHPYYFAELTRQFINDSKRYTRFWQAPLVYHNNIWEIASSVRMMTYFTDAIQMADLANPFSYAFPLSTYSLSLQLAVEVNYWDRAVISEDWHMYLRSVFGSSGQAKLIPIFLPTTGDAVVGKTLFDSWKNFYEQQLRHAWGAEDMGYFLQQSPKQNNVPFMKKVAVGTKLFYDQLVFSIAGVFIPVGTVLSIILEKNPVITLVPAWTALLVFFVVINSMWGLSMLSMWMTDRIYASRSKKNWSFFYLIKELILWFALPVLTFLMVALPVIHAQTRMMFGAKLYYKTAPKLIDSKTDR